MKNIGLTGGKKKVDLESHQEPPYEKKWINCPQNKMRSLLLFFSQVGVKNRLKKFGSFDNLIMKSLKVISPGRHEPTLVTATGCCEMSPYYLSAAKG